MKAKSSLFPTTSNFMSPTRHNGTFTQELGKNVEGSEHLPPDRHSFKCTSDWSCSYHSHCCKLLILRSRTLELWRQSLYKRHFSNSTSTVCSGITREPGSFPWRSEYSCPKRNPPITFPWCTFSYLPLWEDKAVSLESHEGLSGKVQVVICQQTSIISDWCP